MMRRLSSLVSAGLVAFSIGSANATTIDFETGAPTTFEATTPLTTLYSPLGVTFSGIGGTPGSILDQGGNFGINAHSGNDFLAFNSDVGSFGDELSFVGPMNGFQLFVGSGQVANFIGEAFDSDHNLIASSSANNVAAGAYQQLVFLFTSNISFVDITSTAPSWVADDLSFTLNDPLPSTTPLPSTWLMLLSGFAGLGFFAYRGAKSRSAGIAAA